MPESLSKRIGRPSSAGAPQSQASLFGRLDSTASPGRRPPKGRLKMSYSFRDHAPALHATGFNPLPILPGTKRPALLGWQRFCSEEMPSSGVAKFTQSSIAYGVGLAPGTVVVGIDVDTDDTAQIRAVISVLPPIRAAKRGRRGFTGFFSRPHWHSANRPPAASRNPFARYANRNAAIRTSRHGPAVHLARSGSVERV